MSNERTCQTPAGDLMKRALEHYKELSDRCCYFSSDIPKAIEFYYRNHPSLSAPSPATPEVEGGDDVMRELYIAVQALWTDKGNPDNWTACTKQHRRNYKDMVAQVMHAMSLYESYIKKEEQPNPEAEGPKRHRWNQDGETCLDCGQKDWMRGSVCTPTSPPAATSQEKVK